MAVSTSINDIIIDIEMDETESNKENENLYIDMFTKHFFIVKSDCCNGYLYYIRSQIDPNKVGYLNPLVKKLFWFNKDNEVLCMKHITEVEVTFEHIQTIIQLLETMKKIVIYQNDIDIITLLQTKYQQINEIR